MPLSAPTVPRRRPPEGGYARGEETRARIVQVALQVFADEGFANASTRRIAAAAGVNPPALQYYFDGKEGLHRACADLIIEEVSVSLDPVLETGRTALQAADAERALDALCDLVDVLADLTVSSTETPVWSRFIARAQGDDASSAYERIKLAISGPMHTLARALVALVIDRPQEDEEVRLRALFVLSQLSSFHHNREHALKALGWSDLGGDRLAAIKAIVRDQTRATLRAARRG